MLTDRASICFKLANASAVGVPIRDAVDLGLHLAVFGPDEEMQRSRLLAEKIATVSLAARSATAVLYLTESQKTDLAAALHRMRDDRAGRLQRSLLELQAVCELQSESLGDEVG